MSTIDTVKPPEKWVFGQDVADAFDDMLSRSIPGHADMRRLVFDLGCCFVKPHTDIVDLGCSRGAALAPFIDRFGADCRHVGLDESGPMLDAARQRFRLDIAAGIVRIQEADLREGLGGVCPSLILAVLTLQFVPIEHRQRVIADAFRLLKPGGAMIVVEKTLGPDAASQLLLVDRYHAHKHSHGYSADQISDKAKSLQGVLVPLTPEANEQLLGAEGFRVVRFWQHLSFCGWIAIKPEGK